MEKIFMFLTAVLIAVVSGCGGGDDAPILWPPTPTPLSSEKAITVFSLDSVVGTIDETAKTIVVTMPFGTDVTALVATFTTTGTSVKIDSIVQASGTTANNFMSPVTYTVTAADATTQDYTVRVTVATGDYTSANIGLLKYVPAGSFQIDATPTNISTISTAFRMSEKEITRAQFFAVMGTDPSSTIYSTGNSDPVQQVNFYHAIVFCNKLSLAEGFAPVYSVTGVNFSTLTYDEIPIGEEANWDAAIAEWSANGYRLPTEMEWMWAAMGATSGSGYTSPTYLTGYAKPFAGSNATNAAGDNGTNVMGDYAVFGYEDGETGSTSTNRTDPVGSKLANELGLYDMSGNVWEWCWDWLDYYPAGTQTDYRGPASGEYHVIRGGTFWHPSSRAAVAYRGGGHPGDQGSALGFRVVRP